MTDASKHELEAAIDKAREAGLTVEAGGTVLESEATGGMGEVIGVALAAGVVLITFGSLAAAGPPLITALLGLTVGVASIMALASVFGLSSTTTELGQLRGAFRGGPCCSTSELAHLAWADELATGSEPPCIGRRHG